MTVPRWCPLLWVLLCACLSIAQADAQAEGEAVYVYPPGCFDDHERPLRPDPENPARSVDRACQPPDPALQDVPEARHRVPPLPVPVPERLDTFTR